MFPHLLNKQSQSQYLVNALYIVKVGGWNWQANLWCHGKNVWILHPCSSHAFMSCLGKRHFTRDWTRDQKVD